MKPAYLPLILCIVAVVLLLIAGPGTRMELWDFRTGFKLMKWAAYTGLAGSVLALVMLLLPRVRRRGWVGLAVAMVLGVSVALVPWSGMRQARSLPPIHDISTDTKRPPEFVAMLPMRADAPNSAEYGGAEIAAAQRSGYPDLETLRLADAPEQAFERARQAARKLGWEIVSTDPAAGRIEATDTTFWFGFKDDVVIRIEPDAGGSRVDVRSLSRVGGSDVGANAARIRAFLHAFSAQ
ncbi:MAG: DUF1499 domain-containing protein [Pseudomonadota bacterium]|nr:DUF1499 domain-containing protein [Pseudomonadota bacterium]